MNFQELTRSLKFKAVNPDLAKGLHADLLLEILESRGVADARVASTALGATSGTEGVRRGKDGVAYAVVRYGEWNDCAYFALTEDEATRRGVPTLADQESAKKSAALKRAATTASQKRFERELDF